MARPSTLEIVDAVETADYRHIDLTRVRPVVRNTDIKVSQIAFEYDQQGLSPDEIVEAHPHLTLAEVHAALTYYYDHAEAIRAEWRDGQALVEAMKLRYPPKHPATSREARSASASWRLHATPAAPPKLMMGIRASGENLPMTRIGRGRHDSCALTEVEAKLAHLLQRSMGTWRCEAGHQWVSAAAHGSSKSCGESPSPDQRSPNPSSPDEIDEHDTTSTAVLRYQKVIAPSNRKPLSNPFRTRNQERRRPRRLPRSRPSSMGTTGSTEGRSPLGRRSP